MFRQILLNNSSQDWILATLVAASLVLGMLLLRGMLLHRLKRLAASTDTVLDDFLVEVLSATRILLASALGLYAATFFLDIPPALQQLIDRAFLGALILQVGFWSNRALLFYLQFRFAQGEPEEEGARAMTRSLLAFLGRTVLWGVVLLLLLDNLGLNVTTLLASLGIGGIAVALAVQNILGDLFASLSIAIDKPFVIGDFICVDDLMGTVEYVGLKTTRIRSLSGEQLVVSNNDLLKSRIRNYKRMRERRVVLVVGVTYDTSIDRLQHIPNAIQQAIGAQRSTRFERAHLKSFGPYSLDFEAVYHVLDADYKLFMDIQHAVAMTLIREFRNQGIEFAFPTQTLHVQSHRQALQVEPAWA